MSRPIPLSLHFEAALEVLRYVEDSTAFIFGTGEENPVADTILEAVRQNPRTRSQVNAILGGRTSKKDIDQAIKLLIERGEIIEETETNPKGGRPKTIYRGA